MRNFTLRLIVYITGMLLLSIVSVITVNAQSCPQNNIGFNADYNANTLTICAGTSGITINGDDPGGQVYLWEVATDLGDPFAALSPDPGDIQTLLINSNYYNTPGTYYFRR